MNPAGQRQDDQELRQGSHRLILVCRAVDATRNGDRRSGSGGPPGRPGSSAASVRGESGAAAVGTGAPPFGEAAGAAGAPSAETMGVVDGGAAAAIATARGQRGNSSAAQARPLAIKNLAAKSSRPSARHWSMRR